MRIPCLGCWESWVVPAAHKTTQALGPSVTLHVVTPVSDTGPKGRTNGRTASSPGLLTLLHREPRAAGRGRASTFFPGGNGPAERHERLAHSKQPWVARWCNMLVQPRAAGLGLAHSRAAHADKVLTASKHAAAGMDATRAGRRNALGKLVGSSSTKQHRTPLGFHTKCHYMQHLAASCSRVTMHQMQDRWAHGKQPWVVDSHPDSCQPRAASRG